MFPLLLNPVFVTFDVEDVGAIELLIEVVLYYLYLLLDLLSPFSKDCGALGLLPCRHVPSVHALSVR